MGNIATPTEEPIRVFISSRMDPDHKPLRDAAAKAVKSNGFEPWLFENGPASDQDAITTYESGVDRSEFFIWITKGTTTVATEREVRRAIKLGKPIIMVMVSMTATDDVTKELIVEVRKSATTRTIDNNRTLRKEIDVALKGLVARRIRQGRNLNLAQILKSLKASSIARCVANFTYVQIPAEIASTLAEDISVGAVKQIQDASKVVVLYGELGAGKTLAAERAHQNAITRAQMGGPFPIWRRADSIRGTLENEVRLSTENLIEPALFGVHLVIDGLDESGLDYANILAESQALSAAWPDTTIILTSRPRPDINDHPLAIKIPELSDQESLRLATLTGVAPHGLYLLTPALQSAVHRPLFALLLGSALKANVAADAPQLLVAHLVSDILKRHKVSDAQRDELISLAIKTTDRRGSVPLLEVPNAPSLMKTGLIVIDGLAVRFSLLVIGQWFAALAIQTKKMNLSTLGNEISRLLLWREPIATAVAVGDENSKNRLLSDAASYASQLFAWLIREAIPSAHSAPVADLPSEHISGEQMRSAMTAAATALGKAATLVTPILLSGQLPPLGIGIQKNGITWSWWKGNGAIPNKDFLRLPAEPNGDFPRITWTRNAGRSGWAWPLVLGDIQSEMEDVLNKRKLPVAPSLQEERDWLIVSTISTLKFGGASVQAIDLHSQIEYILGIDPSEEMEKILYNDTEIFLSELKHLKRRIPVDGTIDPPWPLADLKGGSYSSDNYSRPQLESRIRKVFSAALDAHRWYSENLFESVSSLSPTYAVRPANCDIQIISTDGQGIYNRSLAWSLEPIAENEAESVNLIWTDQGFTFTHDPEHWEYIMSRRPNSEFFGHSHRHEILDIFGKCPSTDLTYRWLSEDLKFLKWVR